MTGIVILVAGAYIFGEVVNIIAAFVAYTYSGVKLDTEARQIQQYNKLFGIVKTGNWKSLNHSIGIALIPISTVEVMASRSIRILSTKTTDYRIYFFNKARKPVFAIKKCKSKENARNSVDEFSLWLKLPVFFVKRDRKGLA